MNQILISLIKTAISRLKEGPFQEFINFLYIKKYMDDFVPVRNKRDKGSDGILFNETIIAVYAPEAYSLKALKKKTKNDHDSYVTNWKATHPKWSFILNGEFTSEAIQFIDSLNPDTEKLDINHIIDLIKSLQWGQLREVLQFLGVDEQFFINDVLHVVIDDLLKETDGDSEGIKHEAPAYMPDKIKLNYSPDDVDSAINEYQESLPILARLKEILKSYRDEEISAIKQKVISGYTALSGNFKDRLNALNQSLAGKNNRDDIYLLYVRVVLIHIFEACLIGKKVESEP